MGVREDMLAPNDDNEMKVIRENYHNNEIFNINEWVENTKAGNVRRLVPALLWVALGKSTWR